MKLLISLIVLALMLTIIGPADASHHTSKTVIKTRIYHGAPASSVIVESAPSVVYEPAPVVQYEPAPVIQYYRAPVSSFSLSIGPAYSTQRVIRQRTTVRHYRSRSVLGLGLCP